MTQEDALKILQTGANVFLTGEPGTGKTYTINEYIRRLRAAGVEPSITAATGIAATHVGGLTIHSWSGIGLAHGLTRGDIDLIASKEHIARRIGKTKVLIIEEVSMLSAGIFKAVDAVCREVKRVELPFGGIQVVLVGDFFQLPPIEKNVESMAFAYDSDVWRDLNPLVCYLTDQHRQDDADYLALLTAIRQDDVEEAHYERLLTRKCEETRLPHGIPRLYSHNADVDRVNTAELAKLSGKVEKFTMSGKGSPVMVEALKRGCLSPEVLELKMGAKVMFTKNNAQGKFVNGTLGTVVGFDWNHYPLIETVSGAKIAVEPMEWQVEEHGKVRAGITQVPLRLAYAITVHKSQGMSMDAAAIDLSKAFAYGQGYVALSRVRRLSGLYLLGINERALRVDPAILEKDQDFRTASIAALQIFAEMPKRELEGLHSAFLKAIGGENAKRAPVRGRAKQKIRS